MFKTAENEKKLPHPLDDFRTALRDEIEVAKRNLANNAVPLRDGQLVAKLGSSFQYAFFIDSILNVPDGAPGDLVVPGKTPIPVSIISIEGLRILLSVEHDLGKFVPSARLQTNLAFLMRRLIERIEDNADLANPAAQRMLGEQPVSGDPERLEEASQIPLNANQKMALESAIGRNHTVIWGPPGTGKTHTIGTIADQLHKLGRTILIVSHTNPAVDQAILHVAKAMPEEQLEQGAVIRLGEVRDKELADGFTDVLLKKQVERQSQELFDKRGILLTKKQELSDKVSNIQQDISIIEWIEDAKNDINSLENLSRELRNIDIQINEVSNELVESERNERSLKEQYEYTSIILDTRKKIVALNKEKTDFEALSLKNDLEHKNTLDLVRNQEQRVEISERITPLRTELASFPPASEQKLTISTLSNNVVEMTEKQRELKLNHDTAKEILEQSLNNNAAMRILKRLPKPDEQRAVALSLAKKLSTVNAELQASEKALESAKGKLARFLELNGELSQHKEIGSHTQELADLRKSQKELEILKELKSDIKIKIRKLDERLFGLTQRNEQLSANIDGDVNVINQEIFDALESIKKLRNLKDILLDEIKMIHAKIDDLLGTLISKLTSWNVIQNTSLDIEESIELIREAHKTLSTKFKGVDLDKLRSELSDLQDSMKQINLEILEIEGKLAQVERNIILNASIVGATLTKTYLSNDIQSRKFDTVILDEASMAPIPALWAAAQLSENNLILVGDFKQLPPIVQSSKELTKKWLGRDIFEASGLKKQYEKGVTPLYFIPLTEQRRMLPEIAKVANIFYDKILKNGPIPPSRREKFLEWYNEDWPYKESVILVDTGSLNAWVTSVVKGGSTSRLNFLSATVSVDLAEQLLRPDRIEHIDGDPKRILIVAPYRAHAKLVSILLRENQRIKKDEVVAGTAHSFQGSEADVVIFDLVVDEPHFKVNLFMPTLDDQLKPLLNVGLTRAKSKLLIIGDFTYCSTLGKKAFLGKTLIPDLLRIFPKIDARDLIPNGLAAKAARAQMTVLGGDIEPDTDRIVVTQTDFFRLLSFDFSRATNHIIIYSPFITQDRLGFLIPQLQAASSRGVSIYIITKSHSERSRSELPYIKKMERQLNEMGVVVIHKMRMHEKLVFIDDNITWSGSLNPLSFSNTQEIMERRNSKSVMEDYFKILRLKELVEIQGKPEANCPICGEEMIAAEGANQPYYWRCVNDDCYSRSIDQPYPFDGVLKCGTCDGELEYGYWGDYPHWRCVSNNRHRQKIFKSHLRLPKMADRIPKREHRRLCSILGIKNFEEYVIKAKQKGDCEQTNLFDELEKPAPNLTLHEAMKQVLLEVESHTMHASELADEIYKRGLYLQKNGDKAKYNQIRARCGNFQDIFEGLPGNYIKLK